jgi:CheY-like chemotaxis protein
MYKPLRILLVDDDVDAADMFGMLLSSWGHEVVTRYDPLQAIDTAAAVRPDLVLLDIGMPRLNGYDACKEIRRSCGARAPLMVAISGLVRREDRARSQDAGFDAHLSKPVDPMSLQELLARVPPSEFAAPPLR